MILPQKHKKPIFLTLSSNKLVFISSYVCNKRFVKTKFKTKFERGTVKNIIKKMKTKKEFTTETQRHGELREGVNIEPQNKKAGARSKG